MSGEASVWIPTIFVLGPAIAIGGGLAVAYVVANINHEPTPGADVAALEEYEDTFLGKDGCLEGTLYDTNLDAPDRFTDEYSPAGSGMRLFIGPSSVSEAAIEADRELSYEWDPEAGVLTPTDDTRGILLALGGFGIDCSAVLPQTQ